MAKTIPLSTVLHLSLLLTLIGPLYPPPGKAQDAPQALVGIEADLKQQVWQGGKYSFYVQLLSSTWFTGTPRFELPDAREGILYKVQASPVLGSINLQGHTYTSQLHEFWFFPQMAGTVTIDTITVDFATSAPPDRPPGHHSLKTDPFTIEVKQIPGVQRSETLIATPRLKVSQTWSPTGTEALVGDALTRSIVMEADDLAGIFLPEIRPGNASGISLYPAPAEVSDRSERGEATGIRREVFTYLFEKEGDYTIEDISLRWWNTDKRRIETTELAGMQVKVSPNPHYQESAAAEVVEKPADWTRYFAVLAAAALCLYLLKRLLPAAADRLNMLRRRYSRSEAAYFRKLGASCRQNQPLSAYNRLYFWIVKREPGQPRSASQLARDSRNPQLTNQLNTLDDALFRPDNKESSWRGKDIYRELKRLRKNYPPETTSSPKRSLND